jgi:hypothetical protein
MDNVALPQAFSKKKKKKLLKIGEKYSICYLEMNKPLK